MFLHEAEYRTESWKQRHNAFAIAQMGVWRWRGIQQHAGRILSLIVGKRVLDVGGADATLGFSSTIVDPQVGVSLDDVGEADVVFSSHTLEHVPDATGMLGAMASKLSAGGHLILHIPAWTCHRWQAQHYANDAQQTPHFHTFRLAGDGCTMADFDSATQRPAVCVDSLVRDAGFDVELAEHCGDDSILIIGTKR